MAGNELGFPKPGGALNLREQLAKKTLRNIRLQGHPYVDLREDGKRYIFFCTLCLAPCYTDTVLFDHFRGSLHRERFAAAKSTLLGPNPWPFDDGALFFHNSNEQEKAVATPKGINDLALVLRVDAPKTNGNGDADMGMVLLGDQSEGNSGSDDENPVCGQKNHDLTIPGVMGRENICELHVDLVGYGRISAKFVKKDELPTGISKIWCEWLGKKDSYDNDMKSVPTTNDFAVVIFNYYYDLGKQGLFEEFKSLLMSKDDKDSCASSGKRPRKSLSDPEDISESLSNQCDSSGEDSQFSGSSSSRLMLDHYNDQLVSSRIISSKSMRKELRKQQRLASERMCDICQHKMLPGKDVAALLNMKTGRLACSRRNIHGAFHVFHTSCLIHWILLCESEVFQNNSVDSNPGVLSKRKSRDKGNGTTKESGTRKKCSKRNLIQMESERNTSSQQIYNLFCPNCQGSSMNIVGDELEKPTYHLSEMFKYKIKLSDAHRAWMKHPEELQNCSTGLHFSPLDDNVVEEKVEPMKLLHFYRADEESWSASP